MTDATQFFAAIIPATAGLVGFLIAIGSFVHSIDSQHLTPRTKELHKTLTELNDDYHHGISGIYTVFSQSFNNGEGPNNDQSEEDIEQSFEELFTEHLKIIQENLSKSSLKGYHNISEEQIENLDKSSRKLREARLQEENIRRIYNHISGKDSENMQIESLMLEEIFDEDDVDGVLSWAENNDDIPSYAKGPNLATITRFLVEYSQEFDFKTWDKKEETLAGYTPPVRTLLPPTLVLVLIGIGLPSIVLIIGTSSFNPSEIFWIQIVILVGYVVSVGYSVHDLLNRM